MSHYCLPLQAIWYDYALLSYKYCTIYLYDGNLLQNIFHPSYDITITNVGVRPQ